ncbi:MAG: hypothetical protein DWH91_05920 [Planctomycetota bacterium]|nr:MAG: hypothetical protein DWH91_05920 [Planctomycetota bacterium]
MGKSSRKPPENPLPPPAWPAGFDPQGLYYNRRLVYGVLVILSCLMLPDAIPQYTLLHGKLREWTDTVLDVTGLWQGSWELFAPTPDHVNVRVGATMTWEEGADTEWMQPDWHSMSPLARTRYFRQMSYYDNLARLANEHSSSAFCEHLAREQTARTYNKLTSITLFQQRDVIPPPDQQWRAAYTAPHFSSRQKLMIWVPDAH